MNSVSSNNITQQCIYFECLLARSYKTEEKPTTALSRPPTITVNVPLSKTLNLQLAHWSCSMVGRRNMWRLPNVSTWKWIKVRLVRVRGVRNSLSPLQKSEDCLLVHVAVTLKRLLVTSSSCLVYWLFGAPAWRKVGSGG